MLVEEIIDCWFRKITQEIKTKCYPPLSVTLITQLNG